MDYRKEKKRMNEQKTDVVIANDESEIEIDLVELFYYYRTKWIPIIITFLIGIILAGGITKYLITPKYQAQSKLYVVSASNDSVVDLADLNIGTALSKDYEKLLYIRPIVNEIIEEKKLPYTYEELVDMITVASIDETRILTITVESINPQEAQDIANAMADKAVAYLPKLMETDAPNIAERAIFPELPSSPNLIKNMLIGGVAGLFIALAFFTVIFLMDDTLQSAEEVEKAFGVMPLTVIPEGDLGAAHADKEKAKKAKRRKLKFLRLIHRKKRKGGGK